MSTQNTDGIIENGLSQTKQDISFNCEVSVNGCNGTQNIREGSIEFETNRVGNDVLVPNGKIRGPAQEDSVESDEFWVFGYGSLVWKVDFPIECQQTGYIEGYLRRFYQNSIDHRGTQEKPGRVVTLIPSEDPASKVFGVAYKIPDNQKAEVIKHLDFREKNGYERLTVTFYPYPELGTGSQPLRNIVIYVATKDNDSFAGHINEIGQIASQIYAAHGPSGSNREYVLRLADAMRALFPCQKDDHLFELEEQLLKRIKENGADI